MRSQQFKYIDRTRPDTIALLPGWASDYRIFEGLNLKFNYLIPTDFSPFTFEENLLRAIEERSIEKVSLFGWSLGGFVAAEFAGRHTNLTSELILVSIRKKYKKEELSEIKKLLKKSKKGYLYKFYTRCFSSREKMPQWFRKNLLRTYCEKFSLDSLLAGIGYLKTAEIKSEFLKNVAKITIAHGEHDKIAPYEEAKAISDELPHARFFSVKNAGHMPFLEKGFLGKDDR